MIADLTMTRIGQGVELHHHQGRARSRSGVVHADLGRRRRRARRPAACLRPCHSMADVQDDVHQELMWDLRALAAVGQVIDERVAQAGVPLTVAGLYPSLHLN
ncbi:hypothetical protein [Actinomadura geliboluensis]|uniref:hypothetical protein n=1 Tax=Actinomadura geliboluensis TaxID=882440 RepID=UPI00197B05B2|nr:hypothetical protein [Actinomadura geliboluensis]